MTGRNIGIALAAGVTIMAATIFVLTLTRATLYDQTGLPAPSVQVAQVLAKKVPVSPAQYPTNISIPAIPLTALVENVGYDKEGRIAPPAHFSRAGWYEYGTVPGEPGTALIIGHLDNGLGYNGAFKHLSEINVGDTINVSGADGSVQHFTVYDIESYPYMNVPASAMTDAKDGGAYLNLITCGGNWLWKQGTYDQRMVVYSKLAT